MQRKFNLLTRGLVRVNILGGLGGSTFLNIGKFPKSLRNCIHFVDELENCDPGGWGVGGHQSGGQFWVVSG